MSGFEAEVFVPAPRDVKDPGPRNASRWPAQKLYLLVQRGGAWEFPALPAADTPLRKAGLHHTWAR